MLSTLHISLLGDFRLVYGDEPLTTVNTARLQSLLGYLVLHHGAAQLRQHLAFRFWPDSTEAQARNNLRQTLHQLRRVLPEAERFLYADTTTVSWRADAPFTLDVARFGDALATADDVTRIVDAAAVRAALEQAISVYQGDLLPSCYDAWIIPERDQLHEQCSRALERLVSVLENTRQYRAAIRYAQQLIRHDPINEASYLVLMRLYSLCNDGAGALRVYHACATTLQHELGIAPNLSIRDAYERLLQIETTSTAGHMPVLIDSSPLIGRQLEWNQLLAVWQRVRRRQVHMVLITGEAGLGKTRLADELLTWAERQGFAVARTRAYAAEGRLSYGPLTEWLRSEPLLAARTGLQPAWLTEIARLLPEILVEHTGVPQPEPLTEHWQRQRLFEALARLVLHARQPPLLLIDDLQWCDQETLEWLHYLLRFDARAPLLVLGTARAEEVSPQHPLMPLLYDLRRTTSVTEIALEPLDATATGRLAASLTGLELDADQVLRLYQETEGNPLFVVETVRATVARPSAVGQSILEARNELLSAQRTWLPPRVHAVIAARLMQLSAPARDLATVAATVGRAFTFEVLAQASDSSEDSLVRSLDELWQRRIIRAHGANAYDFSHDKLREVAYAAIGPARRRQLHSRVAQALQNVYLSDIDSVSAQVASHYTQAQMPQQAITFFQRAAAVARNVYANQAAIVHLDQGLELLRHLPKSAERVVQELDMLVERAAVYMDTRGWAAPESEQAYTRALALCRQVDRPTQLFRVLWGLHEVYLFQARHEQAHAMTAECLQLAEQIALPALLLQAHHAMAGTLSHLFAHELPRAFQHAQQAIAIYDVQHHHAQALHYGGHDPGVCCRQIAAKGLWLLGYPDQAREIGQAAIDLARQLGHPASIALGLTNIAAVHIYRKEPAAVVELVTPVIAVAIEKDMPMGLAEARILHGWALAELGDVERGITEMQQGIADWIAMGIILQRGFHQTLLAQAYWRAGQLDKSLAALRTALAAAKASKERYFESEMHRLSGEFLLAAGQPASEAEAAYRQALQIAQEQGARSLELRAAVSLSRLWQQQGKPFEARQMLAEIYGWFTEGFTTVDLLAARALLDQLLTVGTAGEHRNIA